MATAFSLLPSTGCAGSGHHTCAHTLCLVFLTINIYSSSSGFSFTSSPIQVGHTPSWWGQGVEERVEGVIPVIAQETLTARGG